MRNPIRGAQFRRDVKLAQKRGKDMAKLREVILLLIEGNLLPARFNDHPLAVKWKHLRDCHIEPDWLPIYKVAGDDLYLVRTGTHPICSEPRTCAIKRAALRVGTALFGFEPRRPLHSFR